MKHYLFKILLFVFISWNLGLSKEIYVDPKMGSDKTGLGTKSSPYKSLTFALRKVNQGDKIIAWPGFYSSKNGEVFPIVIPTGITIIGSGMRNTFIVCDKPWEKALKIDVSRYKSKELTLKGFTIQNGITCLELFIRNTTNKYSFHIESIAFESSGIGGDLAISSGELDLKLKRCIFRGAALNGIRVNAFGGKINLDISSSVIAFNGCEGMLLNVSSPMASAKIEMVHSTVTGNNRYGINGYNCTGSFCKIDIYNSIVWGNKPVNIFKFGNIYISHSLVGDRSYSGKNGNKFGDPVFAIKGDWHISYMSPARGLGSSNIPSMPNNDIDNQAYPKGKAPDAGADQFVLHSLIECQAGMISGRDYSLLLLTKPESFYSVYISGAVTQNSFKLPGFSGEFVLDMIFGIVKFMEGKTNKLGSIVFKRPMPCSEGLHGFVLYFQGFDLKIEGSRYEGGFTNLVAQTFIAP